MRGRTKLGQQTNELAPLEIQLALLGWRAEPGDRVWVKHEQLIGDKGPLVAVGFWYEAGIVNPNRMAERPVVFVRVRRNGSYMSVLRTAVYPRLQSGV